MNVRRSPSRTARHWPPCQPADACASPSADELGDLSKEADKRIKDEVR